VLVAAHDGVSGARTGISPENRALLDRVRASGVTAPLTLGFGIADGDGARAAVACGADGIVVGSAVVAAAMDSGAALRAILQELRKAVDE
jgi:tryptophan synthase alpha chain